MNDIPDLTELKPGDNSATPSPTDASLGTVDPGKDDVYSGQLPSFLLAFVDRQVDKVMDMTIGRYQVVEHHPQVLPDFVNIARNDIAEFLHFVCHKARESVPNPDQAEASAVIKLLSDDLLHEKQAHALTKQQLATVLEEVRKTRIENNLVDGQLVRRDKLLKEQQIAYLRDLTLLKESVWQLKHKGRSEVPDVSYFAFSVDPLGQDVKEEEKMRLEKVIDDMKAKLEKERDCREAVRMRELEEYKTLFLNRDNKDYVTTSSQTDVSAFQFDDFKQSLAQQVPEESPVPRRISLDSQDSSDLEAEAERMSIGSDDTFNEMGSLGASGRFSIASTMDTMAMDESSTSTKHTKPFVATASNTPTSPSPPLTIQTMRPKAKPRNSMKKLKESLQRKEMAKAASNSRMSISVDKIVAEATDADWRNKSKVMAAVLNKLHTWNPRALTEAQRTTILKIFATRASNTKFESLAVEEDTIRSYENAMIGLHSSYKDRDLIFETGLRDYKAVRTVLRGLVDIIRPDEFANFQIPSPRPADPLDMEFFRKCVDMINISYSKFLDEKMAKTKEIAALKELLVENGIKCEVEAKTENSTIDDSDGSWAERQLKLLSKLEETQKSLKKYEKKSAERSISSTVDKLASQSVGTETDNKMGMEDKGTCTDDDGSPYPRPDMSWSSPDGHGSIPSPLNMSMESAAMDSSLERIDSHSASFHGSDVSARPPSVPTAGSSPTTQTASTHASATKTQTLEILVGRLRRELEYKDRVLYDKRVELDRTMEEVEGWFEKYSKPGHNPFTKHFECLQHLRHAFDAAEASEELYRISGWGAMVMGILHRRKMQDARAQVKQVAIEGSAYYNRLMRSVLALENKRNVHVHRLQNDRTALKEQSNSHWDRVLCVARGLIKPKGRVTKYLQTMSAKTHTMQYTSPFVRPSWQGKMNSLGASVSSATSAQAESSALNKPARPKSAPMDSLLDRAKSSLTRPPSAPLQRVGVGTVQNKPSRPWSGGTDRSYGYPDSSRPTSAATRPSSAKDSARSYGHPDCSRPTSAATRPSSAKDSARSYGYPDSSRPSSAASPRPTSAGSSLGVRKRRMLPNEEMSREQDRQEKLRMLYWDRKMVMEDKLRSELANSVPAEVPSDINIGRLVGKHEALPDLVP